MLPSLSINLNLLIGLGFNLETSDAETAERLNLQGFHW